MCLLGSRGWFAALLAGLVAPALAVGAEATATGVAFFEQKIRPVLVQECYQCHSAEAKAPKGGLRLDSRAGLLTGGDSGPAVVPGAVDESLIVEALRHEGLQMPPKGKLPDAVIADFERWIRMGAPDPRAGQAAPTKSDNDPDAAAPSWAFQTPRHHEVPEVSDGDWPHSDIDRFLLAALEAKGLEPVRDADRLTLIRRATIDLTGLPPTLEEIDAFIADPAPAPDALARVVDRLLASPRYGERWGRHWLDVARYADSNGKDENLTFHDAFRYRDYVIAAFNRDTPYDDFVREQMAGDLLPADDQAQQDEQLTGTGFLVVGPKVLADRDTEKRKMDVVDEQIDAVGRTFLGLTIACARCHDHKFDPIPTADYYALAGIFSSTRTLDGMKLNNPVVSGWMLRPLGADGAARLAAQKEHQKALSALADRIKKAQAKRKDHDDPTTREELERLKAEQEALKAAGPPAPPLVLAVRDEDHPADVRINIRGNPRNLGPEVPRGFLSRAGSTSVPAIPAGQSGRRELALWLTDPANPLTARVMVNRVWQHLLGEGLVRTVDNFGRQGERPSHPELLDELALRFVADGWSVKRLVRSIMLSRVYQLACVEDPAAAQVDPEDRLLWRAHRRRVEAEVIRDAILAVSGRLDAAMGGSAVASLGERAIDNESKGGLATEGNTRRSVYLPVIRNDLPPVFEAFDFADPDVSTGKRDTTTVATQALFLMNSPFVMDQARLTARRLLALPLDDAGRLTDLFRHALGRPPTEVESQHAGDFLGDDPDLDAWTEVCLAVFGCTEFRFVE
jgi:cytochrome c553